MQNLMLIIALIAHLNLHSLQQTSFKIFIPNAFPSKRTVSRVKVKGFARLLHFQNISRRKWNYIRNRLLEGKLFGHADVDPTFKPTFPHRWYWLPFAGR